MSRVINGKFSLFIDQTFAFDLLENFTTALIIFFDVLRC